MTTNKNLTQRLSESFMKEIEEIIEQREQIGIDVNPPSVRMLSALLIKHSCWREIKEDMILFDFKGKRKVIIQNE